MTSKYFYKVLVLFLSFSLKITKRVEAAEQNHRVEGKAVGVAAGSQKKTSAMVSLSVNTCTVSSVQLTPQHATIV